MTTTQTQLDPKSYVARVIEDLEANPEARTLLLRALLTDEFLEMPPRLERVEKTQAEHGEILAEHGKILGEHGKTQGEHGEILGELVKVVGELSEAQRSTDRRVSNLERDVSVLKGDSLEWKLFKRIRPLVSQMMSLRRSQIMLSGIVEAKPDIETPLMEAVENGVITASQEMRVLVTDYVLRAEWNEDRSQVWIAVEVSNNIGQRDIERVKASADALGAVFGDAVGVVAGYRIHPRDRERADDSGVRILLVDENFWME